MVAGVSAAGVDCLLAVASAVLDEAEFEAVAFDETAPEDVDDVLEDVFIVDGSTSGKTLPP